MMPKGDTAVKRLCGETKDMDAVTTAVDFLMMLERQGFLPNYDVWRKSKEMHNRDSWTVQWKGTHYCLSYWSVVYQMMATIAEDFGDYRFAYASLGCYLDCLEKHKAFYGGDIRYRRRKDFIESEMKRLIGMKSTRSIIKGAMR